MSDIVDRLLDTTDRDRIDDAIHEITALRTEVERLERDYDSARDAHDRRVRELDAHCVEVERLRAEVERLRAALRWFVDEYNRVQPMRQARVHAPDCRCILCAYDNARAALGDKEST